MHSINTSLIEQVTSDEHVHVEKTFFSNAQRQKGHSHVALLFVFSILVVVTCQT